MRKAVAVVVTAAFVSGAALAAPAVADTTSVTVAVATGGLSLDVSLSSAQLTAQSVATIVPGVAVSGSLGTTTVDDTRGTSTGWTANVAATDFVSGANTIGIGAATITTGAVAGLSLPTLCGIGGVVTFPASITLSTSAQELGKCAHLTAGTVIGANSAQWSNTMTLTLPATAAGGTYTSTVTQSVQ